MLAIFKTMLSGSVLFGSTYNMNVTSFYGCRAVRQIATVSKALEEIQRDGDIHADTVVILPPEAGDTLVDSDGRANERQ